MLNKFARQSCDPERTPYNVRSTVDPVSHTTHAFMNGITESRAAVNSFSSFLTIMLRHKTEFRSTLAGHVCVAEEEQAPSMAKECATENDSMAITLNSRRCNIRTTIT